ncbi:rhodanese-like domain-containing protein [Ekhidna sp.]|uniref:rhodanese-like domain-containing protein n=1 Tax=Ekhidna sp. TaxID=2608089 RepID=UPI003C7A3322
MNDLTINRRLALIGFGIVLAGLVMALAFPEGLNGVNRQPQFIGVVELAEKIKNREMLDIVDLRDARSYEEFHIPTASNVPLDEFNPNLITKQTIVYSGDDLLVRRLWDTLPDSLRDHTVIVHGGVHDWFDRVLYPTLPFGDGVTNKSLVNKVHELCQFYGGFADFENDAGLIEYYEKDLTKASWPKVYRTGGLIRKGC